MNDDLPARAKTCSRRFGQYFKKAACGLTFVFVIIQRFGQARDEDLEN